MLIDLKDIHADESFNCRGKIDPVSVVELAKDIDARGLIQPIIITEYTKAEREIHNYKYRIIAGHRRYMAHVVARKKDIKCIICNEMHGEVDARLYNLTENLHRQDLTIRQEARAVKALFDLGLNRRTISERLGMSDGWVQVRTDLLKLPADIQDEIERSGIKQSDIRRLYTIYNGAGLEKTQQAVRELKDAKAKRTEANIDRHVKNNLTKKCMRTKPQIFNMQTLIRETIGNGLTTRALAWAAGEISEEDFLSTLAETCETLEIPFVIPEGGCAGYVADKNL
jgi:ParB/RepB/Spo0J family partition protein